MNEFELNDSQKILSNEINDSNNQNNVNTKSESFSNNSQHDIVINHNFNSGQIQYNVKVQT